MARAAAPHGPRPWQAVDHVMVRVARAEPLFDALHHGLGLPVGWPLQQAGFATYGWIGVGNTQLEIWADRRNADLPADAVLPMVHGFALAPARLDTDLATLRARGLRHRAPRAFESPDADGVARTNFTNAVIEDLSSPRCCVFCCDWAPGAPIVPWRRDADAAERHAARMAALAECRGGALGITGLRRIVLAAPDAAAAAQAWRAATGQPQGAILLADGIELAIASGPRHQVQALHLGVRDAGAARDFLAAKQWLGTGTEGGGMRLGHPACDGLELRLVPDPA